MTIVGLGNITVEQLREEINCGAKFVMYTYCVSILVITFKRSGSIYYIRAGGSRFTPGLKYSLISLALGWWGIPWGPIYTIGCVASNCMGGKDITATILDSLVNAN